MTHIFLVLIPSFYLLLKYQSHAQFSLTPNQTHLLKPTTKMRFTLFPAEDSDFLELMRVLWISFENPFQGFLRAVACWWEVY